MPAHRLTGALHLRLFASAWTCCCPYPANLWKFFWLTILSGQPQTLMNHLEMSHPNSWNDDSLTDVSLVLSRAYFFSSLFYFGFVLNMLLMSHCSENGRDYTCACFAHNINLLSCSSCKLGTVLLLQNKGSRNPHISAQPRKRHYTAMSYILVLCTL